MRAPWLSVIAVVLASAGCVSRATYEEARSAAANDRAALERERDAAAQRALASRLEAERLRTERDDLAHDATVARARGNVLALELWIRRTRTPALVAARSAAARRLVAIRDLFVELEHVVDTGDVIVTVRKGRLVVVMPNDVLFAPGQVELSARGRAALVHVAGALRATEGQRFQVAGHTDDAPIVSSRFASNWELSAARAIEVVRLLVRLGVKPEVLSAAGYGPFDPVASNDGAAQRARNRRIEITVEPDVDDLVLVP